MGPAQPEQLPLVCGAPPLAQQRREQALGMPLHGLRQRRYHRQRSRRRVRVDRRDFFRAWKPRVRAFQGILLHDPWDCCVRGYMI